MHRRHSPRLGTCRPPVQQTYQTVSSDAQHQHPRIGYISMHDTVADIVICHLASQMPSQMPSEKPISESTSSTGNVQNVQNVLRVIVIDDIQTVSVDHTTLLEHLLSLQRKWHITAYYCNDEDYEAINGQMMQLAMHYLSANSNASQWVSISPLERDTDINRRHYTSYVSYLQKQLYVITPQLLRDHMIQDALQVLGVKGVVDAISGATEVLNLYARYL